MSDIELVIDIPKEVYDHVLKAKSTPDVLGIDIVNVINAVKNGTPLPKGHGRLGDLDELAKDMIYGIKSGNGESWYAEYPHINDVDDCVDLVKYYDAIIEADKAESEELK